jgi:tRNA 2-thiouridine synthesizing protein A
MANVDKSIDARGTYCPGPLMELIKGLKTSPVDSVVEVWSSDSGSAKDIPEWVKKVGHEMAHSIEEDGYWKIAVRKMK